MKDWSREKVMRLIELYREQPMLWNPDDKNFKNYGLRDDVWNEISKKLGCRDPEKKMSTLTVQFRREVRKLRQKNAMRNDDECTSKWFAYDALYFLKDKGKNRFDKAIHSPEPAKVEPSEPWLPPANHLNYSIEDVECESSLNINHDEIKDEYSAFADMVAIKLRKLPTLKAKNKAMNLITNALFQMETELEGECETEMVY